MKYARVAGEIGKLDLSRYENIVFAGFFALTNSEKAVLKHLTAGGARILLEAGPGLEEQFAFLGLKAPAAFSRCRPRSCISTKLPISTAKFSSWRGCSKTRPPAT